MTYGVHHQSKLALGSDVTLLVVTNEDRAVVEAYLNQLWQRIFRFERQFSRFLPLSELSQFNRQAGVKQFISTEFQAILQSSARLSDETDGLYNPFVLPVLQRAGYRGSFVGDYGSEPEIDFSASGLTTAEKLKIGPGWASIPYGTAIDLGGCGKGYLGDMLATEDMPDWVSGFWFSFGGDIVGGGHDEAGQPWSVAITDTLDAGQPPIGTFVSDGASFHIATSSVRERRGRHNDRPWHHIIDPRSGRPAASDVVSATVVADSLVMADVLASCAIILGSEPAPEFLTTRGVESAVLAVQPETGSPDYISYGPSIRINQTVTQGIV